MLKTMSSEWVCFLCEGPAPSGVGVGWGPKRGPHGPVVCRGCVMRLSSFVRENDAPASGFANPLPTPDNFEMQTVLIVNEATTTEDGRGRVLSHVEIWPEEVTVCGRDTSAPRVERVGMFDKYYLEDDIGTEYRSTGGHIGGSHVGYSWQASFTPRPPEHARALYVIAPDGYRLRVELPADAEG